MREAPTLSYESPVATGLARRDPDIVIDEHNHVLAESSPTKYNA